MVKTLFSLLPLLFLVGCNKNPIYRSGSLHSDMFAHKNEAALSFTGDITGIDFKTGYAFSDMFFAVGSAGLHRYSYDEEGMGTQAENYKSKYGEIGLGYYKPFNKVYRFEAFAGYEYGVLHMEFRNPPYSGSKYIISDKYDGGVRKIFLQTNIGQQGEKYQGCFMMQVANVSYGLDKSIVYDYILENKWEKDITIPDGKYDESVWVFGAGVSGKIGLKWLSFEAQFILNWPMYNLIRHEGIYLGVGAYFNFYYLRKMLEKERTSDE